MEEQQGHKIREMLTVLFKHKWKVVISLVSLSIITLIVAFFFFNEKDFVARSVLMVKLGREFVATPEVGETRTPINQEAIINAEKQILTSRDLINRVVQEMGPGNVYPKLAKEPMSGGALQEMAIMEFLQNVFVKEVPKSNLIEVYFRHENPYVAAKALSFLIDFFKEKHLQVFSDSKSSFLEEQLKHYREQLKESESTLEGYKQRYKVYSLDEQRSMLLKQRSEIEFSLASEQSRINELYKKREFVKSQKDIVSEGVANELRTQLNTLQRKEQELLEKYTENNRSVVNLRKEITMIKEQLQKQEDEVRKTQLTAIDAELKPLEVKVGSLRRQLDQLNKETQSVDSHTMEYRNLQRAASVNETNFQTYQKKLEEARIAEDMDMRKMTNITVIQAATVPVKPMPGKKNKVLGVGLFLSFAISFGLAFVSEYLPQTLTSPRAAEKHLRLPILTTIALKK
jgi:polysaccharide biosynthesis protein PslE